MTWLLPDLVLDADGVRRDIQLKGSGPTPFSRRGDGRAALGPVLREYIVSEAMFALGIPTTRSLAAVTSGERVQRETMRLEFLRQERAREEMRLRPGPRGEAVKREQDRQLESKVRREEERFATLQRMLEAGEMEEEKRREKIAEMERKLAELRSDIVDAERQRSDLRHQADLVQTELKNHEAALERVKRLS